MIEYTCNHIHKVKGRPHFCELALGHEGEHREGELTWRRDVFGDEDLPLW